MTILKIAFRNLNRQKRRSGLLAAAIAFAFFAVLFLDGMLTGALHSLAAQLAKTFGGHVFVMGAQKAPDRDEDEDAQLVMSAEDIGIVEQTMNELGIKTQYTVHRIRASANLIFEGQEPAIAQVDGVKFDQEKLLRDSIVFKDGSWEDMKQENAILISQVIAETLNVQFNDILLAEVEDFSGRVTVEEVQVKGISLDKSAFSSLVTYVNFDFLHKLQNLPEGSIGLYAFLLENGAKQNEFAQSLEDVLREKNLSVTSRTQAYRETPQDPQKSIFNQLNDGKWSGTKLAVASFNDFAPQLGQMASMIKRVGLGVLAVLLTVTMIGISNTFKIIVHERKGEIGTMRSCGIKKRHVKHLFIGEALFLSMIGAAAGSVFALIVMQILCLIPFDVHSAIGLFTNNGYLMWKLSPLYVAAEFAVMFFLTLFSVRASAAKAADMIPAEALRTGK